MNEYLYNYLENHPEAPVAQHLFNEEQLEEFAEKKRSKKAFQIAGITGGTIAALGGGAYAGKKVFERQANAVRAHVAEHAGSGPGGTGWSARVGGTGGTGKIGGLADRLAQRGVNPEEATWRNTGRQWGIDTKNLIRNKAGAVASGISNTAGQVREWAGNHTHILGKEIPNLAIVGAGVGVAAGGTAIARKLYLNKRMKQTGAKTTKAFKEIARARSAERKALKKIAGMNRKTVKQKLAKKYGY